MSSQYLVSNHAYLKIDQIGYLKILYFSMIFPIKKASSGTLHLETTDLAVPVNLPSTKRI